MSGGVANVGSTSWKKNSLFFQKKNLKIFSPIFLNFFFKYCIEILFSVLGRCFFRVRICSLNLKLIFFCLFLSFDFFYSNLSIPNQNAEKISTTIANCHKLFLFLQATQLWGLERNYSFLALGSDILTPWHQKLNWPICHLPHAIYSPAFREFEKKLGDLNKKSQNLKNIPFQIKGVTSYSEEASSQNRKQNLNAQGAEKISTTIANCHKLFLFLQATQ